MTSIWTKLFARQCDHEDVLVVTSVGVRRAICESCGHFSFTIEPTVEERAAGPAIKLKAPTRDKTELPRAEGF